LTESKTIYISGFQFKLRPLDLEKLAAESAIVNHIYEHYQKNGGELSTLDQRRISSFVQKVFAQSIVFTDCTNPSELEKMATCLYLEIMKFNSEKNPE
jgi:hypothetical protein